MIAKFTPLDIECLVKTAVELWEQIDVSDLSERQQEVLNRARDAMIAEYEVEEPRTPVAITHAGPRPQEAWVLRRWDRHDDETTLWADENSALQNLAEHARSRWDSIADRDDVPDRPPVGDRQAVGLYYGSEQERGDEGYTLYADEVRSNAPPGGDRLGAKHDYQFPSEKECERANRAATFHPVSDEETLPCVEVAGIQVYTYLDPTTQAVRVSIHLDTTDAALLRPDATVPLCVTCGDEVIFNDAEPSVTPPR